MALNLTFPPGGVLNDSMTLTWLSPEHPSGVIRLYELQQSSSAVDTFVNTTDNTTTIVLSNLVPGTQYNFSVRAFTVAFGPFSDELSVLTADGEDALVALESALHVRAMYKHNSKSLSCYLLIPLFLLQYPQCHKVSMPPAIVPPLCW